MFIVSLHTSLFTITKFAYRNRQPSGGKFPLAVFLCVELNIEINKNMNWDAVVIPRKPV
jgi:hypothetical protein